jgi:hypothetical protein
MRFVKCFRQFPTSKQQISNHQPQTKTKNPMIENDWINRAEQIRLRLTQLRDSL